MKVVLATVTFTTPYSVQRRFLSLGYIHAHAVVDDYIGPRAEIVHRYYDPSLYDPDEIAEQIAQDKPDIVGFTCYVWNTPDNLAISCHLKKMLPDVEIILGGPEVSYHYNRVLTQNSQIDWIAVGEGEVTFREFLRAKLLDKDLNLAAVPGLSQRKDGKPFLPAPRPYQKDLDELASPYLTGVMDVCPVRGGVTYQTARGCPFVCTYCDYGRNQPYFEFSTDRVRKEFELFKEHNTRILFSTDPTFNYSRKRAEFILNLVLDLDIKAVHWFEVFPTLINEDLIELVDRSHHSFVGCGIQTCTPETMRNIRRVWRPEKIAPLLDRLRGKPNVTLSYEIIMGLPGDGLQEFKNTMSWTYDRKPADIKSFNLAILSRTPLEREVDKWDIKYDANIGHEILSTKFMSQSDVLIGRTINEWHCILQGLFARLREVIDKPAADLIEQWGWRVFHAGYHDDIPELKSHRIRPEVIETLADLFQGYVKDLCAEMGVPDVAPQFRDYLRYHLYRRGRTWPSTFFGDGRDIFFHEPMPELHQVYSAEAAELPEQNGTLGMEVPQLGGDLDLRTFKFDMRELYPVIGQDIAKVQPRDTDFVFFMRPDTGAGCGIVIDEMSRHFIELVDGETTVKEIGEQLALQHGVGAKALATRIYAAFQKTGIFTRPHFLTEFEDGVVTWKSSFPEHYRAYH